MVLDDLFFDAKVFSIYKEIRHTWIYWISYKCWVKFILYHDSHFEHERIYTYEFMEIAPINFLRWLRATDMPHTHTYIFYNIIEECLRVKYIKLEIAIACLKRISTKTNYAVCEWWKLHPKKHENISKSIWATNCVYCCTYERCIKFKNAFPDF